MRASTTPSPQSTFVLEIVPSGSDDVMETVTVCPVVAVVVEMLMEEVGGLSDTVI